MSLKKKRQLKITQPDIFKDLSIKLTTFFKELTTAVTKSARDDAASPPPKEAKVKSLPEVNKVKYACSKMLAGIAKLVKGMLDTALTNFQQADSRIRENQPFNTKIVDLQTAKKDENARLADDYSNKDIALQDIETDLKNDLKIHKLDLQNKTKHALLWSCLLAALLALLISGSEVFYTAKGFELTGLSYYERFFVAIGIGLSTIFVGVGVIEILYSNWKSLWKIVGVVTSFLLICGVYLVIGKIRVDLLKIEMASGVEFSDLSAFDFLLINLIFFVAIMLIHRLLWPSKDRFRDNSEYYSAKNQVIQKEKEVKNTQKERLNLPNELLNEQTKVSEHYDKSIAEIEKEFADLESKRAESQTIYNNVYGRLLELYDEINFFYKETIGLYITTMNKYRNDGVFLTMDEPLENLPNPFQNFKYLDDDNPTELEAIGKKYSDININFDELLTNTNDKNHENVSINN